jgi:hypothetical protein
MRLGPVIDLTHAFTGVYDVPNSEIRGLKSSTPENTLFPAKKSITGSSVAPFASIDDWSLR